MNVKRDKLSSSLLVSS